MESYKKGGLINKYEIKKTNGNPIDPEAKYFILRYDKDPHAIQALKKYAESVRKMGHRSTRHNRQDTSSS